MWPHPVGLGPFDGEGGRMKGRQRWALGLGEARGGPRAVNALEAGHPAHTHRSRALVLDTEEAGARQHGWTTARQQRRAGLADDE